MKNILNLKVKFQPSNDVEYKFTPKVNKTYTEDDCECVEYHIDPRKIFNFGVYANANSKQKLIIKSISINQVNLTQFDVYGKYWTANGIRQTHGYMDEPGEYKFKIRYNALSHEFLTYLLTPKYE